LVRVPTLLGSVPEIMLNVGAGEPVAVTEKELLWPVTKVVELELVNAGACKTVSDAALEVTVDGEPSVLVTTTRYW
jgi:hypothetical protein